jgi:hypothetical protein
LDIRTTRKEAVVNAMVLRANFPTTDLTASYHVPIKIPGGGEPISHSTAMPINMQILHCATSNIISPEIHVVP